jgi:hypothetical protein
MTMRYRGGEKPSRFSSGLAVVAGAGIVLSGLAALVGGADAFVVCFVATWVIVFAGTMIYHGANLLTPHETPDTSVHAGTIYEDHNDAEEPVEERLSRLHSLRNAGLVTDEEYQQKRREILGDL